MSGTEMLVLEMTDRLEAMRQERDAALARVDAAKAAPCVWAEEGEGEYWSTRCGQANWFADGGPAENRYRFCPYCGNPIEVQQ